MKTSPPLHHVDLFDGPTEIPASQKEKLFSLNNKFFDVFEECILVMICALEGTGGAIVHFYVDAATPIQRIGLFQGFIYGYFDERK